MRTVGFVGPGQMGEPMVERLLAAGHRVQVHARRPEVQERLAAAGAALVDSARAAAAGAEVVIACLFSDSQLVESVEGPDGVLAGLAPGAVVVSHVTGERTTVTRLAAAAAAVGAHLLDGPVSGGPVEIRAGRLTVLLGGDPDPVERATAVLTSYADPVLPTGPLTSGLAVKLVNNVLFAVNAQTSVAALDLGRQLGVEPALLLEALRHCSSRSYAGEVLALVQDPDRFEAGLAPTVTKDVSACEVELKASAGQADLLLDLVRRGPMHLLRES